MAIGVQIDARGLRRVAISGRWTDRLLLPFWGILVLTSWTYLVLAHCPGAPSFSATRSRAKRERRHNGPAQIQHFKAFQSNPVFRAFSEPFRTCRRCAAATERAVFCRGSGWTQFVL